MSEKINGTIVRINYYNKDNGYTVGLFELDYNDITIAQKKNKIIGNTITVVGTFDRKPIEDEEYELSGNFVKNKNYGLQFAIDSFSRKEIASAYGLMSYLSSDLFPGVGIKAAKIVVETLGLDAISKIKQNAECLETVDITPKQRLAIKEGVSSDVISQEATVFFLENGVTLDTAHKIISLLGNDVISIVRENPYILMDKVERFGFKKNDVFALKIGVKKTDKIRLKALICYILKEVIFSSGNSYVSKSTLYERVISYLEEEIEAKNFQDILLELYSDKKIYLDKQDNEQVIFDYNLYKEELELSLEISKLLLGKRRQSDNNVGYGEEEIVKQFNKVKAESFIEFNQEQEKAILSAFTEPLVIVTGGPGTGKTTIVHAIINLYLKLNKESNTLINEIALLAPTGRAAKRLKETTLLPSQTIHKFLGYMGGNKFTYNKYNKTSARLIIIDEASMMDLSLAHRLFTSMHDDARVIIVGDVDQLPSVGPGQILKDLINTKEIKTIRLSKIHRQAEDSSIVKLAHSVNEGIVPENIFEKKHDRNFIQTDNDHIMPMLIDLVKRAIEKGKDIQKDIQILVPMYRGDVGINEINNQIQELVNPLHNELEEIKHLGRSFRPKDKVIQLVNRADKNIMNGDIGEVLSIKYKNSKPSSLSVLYDIGIIEYELEELEDIALAYAISVHKAQGSEFDIVIMPISTMHYVMLKRKLIYTGITRAKKSLIMIGDVKALQMGISKIEVNRNTILKDKIIEYLHSEKTVSEDINTLKKIDDEESAFDSIGEKDFGTLSLSDFE